MCNCILVSDLFWFLYSSRAAQSTIRSYLDNRAGNYQRPIDLRFDVRNLEKINRQITKLCIVRKISRRKNESVALPLSIFPVVLRKVDGITDNYS